MFFKKLLLAVVIITAAQGLSFAQADNDEVLNKSIADLSKISMNPYHSYVMPFLAKSDDSWLVLITKQGGIMGEYYLVAAITSEGDSICKEKDEYKTYPLKDEIKLGLLGTVSKFKFAKLEYNSKKKTDGYTGICNDCLWTSMEIFHRETKKKLKTYSFNMSALDDSNTSKLFASVVDSYKCPPPPDKN